MADISKPQVRSRWQMGINLLFVLLAGSYFIWTVVNHQRIGSLLANTFNINDPGSYNRVFLQFGVLFLGIYLAATIPFYVRGKRYLALGYLFLAITLTAACVPWLIVVNSEMIHFAQYALLGVLLFPLVRSYWLTVVVGTLLGAIDEGIQYWVWTPDMHYFDFNDVLFNLLGTVLGVLLIGAWLGHAYPGRSSWRAGWGIIGSIAFLAALGWLTQWLDIYPRSNSSRARAINSGGRNRVLDRHSAPSSLSCIASGTRRSGHPTHAVGIYGAGSGPIQGSGLKGS